MSQLPVGPLDRRKPDLGKTETRTDRLQHFHSWESVPQGQPHPTVPASEQGPNRSTDQLPYSIANAGLSPPVSGSEGETRLPGVRQLLQPQSFTPSDHSTPSTRHHSEQSRPFSLTRSSPSTDNIQSASRRVSEISIRTPLSDQYESTYFRGQPDAMVAANRRPLPSMQASPKIFPMASPFKEPFLSPQSSRFNSLQPNGSYFSTPGINTTTNYGSFGNLLNPYPGHHTVDSLTPGSLRTNPWHAPPSHPDWGITKAGNPRKRLAQACLNCRHKKIRCSPLPNCLKCAQCEKYNSTCRFESGCVTTKAIPQRG
jgi:hypothetical protein